MSQPLTRTRSGGRSSIVAQRWRRHWRASALCSRALRRSSTERRSSRSYSASALSVPSRQDARGERKSSGAVTRRRLLIMLQRRLGVPVSELRNKVGTPYHGAIILLPRGPIYRRALSRPTGILGAAPVELDARVLDSPTAADGCRHAKCGTTAAAVDRKQLAQRFKTRRVRCLNAACNCMEAAHSSGPGRWFGFRTLSAAGSCRKQMDSWRLEGVKWTG